MREIPEEDYKLIVVSNRIYNRYYLYYVLGVEPDKPEAAEEPEEELLPPPPPEEE